MNRIRIAALALVLLACGPKEPPLDQFDAAGVLDRGIEAYRAEEWNDAIRYLDHFVLENPTHPRVQEARFYLADAYFGKEEYITAAGRFTRLAEDFPNGQWADDARYKVCESYRELSPDPTLDQTYTQAAIDHCQSVVVYHPESDHVPAARAIISAMENKLARKEFLNGEFYRKREAFDSAIIYYELVLARWPQADAAPDALRAMIESYQEIGYDEEAAAARERLLRDYPAAAQPAAAASGAATAGESGTAASASESGTAASAGESGPS